MIEAGIAATEGRAPEAIAGYREAFADCVAIGIRWEQALTGLDAAILLDPPEPEVARIAAETRVLLAELDARPFMDRLDARLGAGVAAASS